MSAYLEKQMKPFLLIVMLLAVAAPVAGEETFYYFNEAVFQETYVKLLCQATPDDIQRTLDWYETHPPIDAYQSADRDILQQCLPSRRQGETFELSKSLLARLRAGLNAVRTSCPHGLLPLSLDAMTHDEWRKQLKLHSSFDKELRNNLITRFDSARRKPPCGTVVKN
jgi:hypothetical protein